MAFLRLCRRRMLPEALLPLKPGLRREHDQIGKTLTPIPGLWAQTSFGGSHPLLLQTKKNLSFQTGFLNMVGERGFEPPTHWSQTSCATKLRYSPMGAHVTATPDQRQPLFALLPSIAWKARGC